MVQSSTFLIVKGGGLFISRDDVLVFTYQWILEDLLFAHETMRPRPITDLNEIEMHKRN